MHGTIQARHAATPLYAWSLFVNGSRLGRRQCRCGSCQEIFSDLTSKRDAPCRLLINGSKRNIFLRTALDPIFHWSNIPLFQIRAKSLSSLSGGLNEGI
jgi:hypothetical protein